MTDFTKALNRLSATYYNSQPVSPDNPGGLAADGHVVNFPAALSDVAEVARVMETWIATLGGDNLNKVDDLTALIESHFSAKGRAANIFVDAVNGDDENTGRLLTKPIRTARRLFELMTPFKNVVHLFSDLDIDHYAQHAHSCRRLEWINRRVPGAESPFKTIRVLDAKNNRTHPGGIRLNGSISTWHQNVNIEIATGRGFGLYELNGIAINNYFGGCRISRTGSGSACLFYFKQGANLYEKVSGTTLDNSAAGYLYTDVAAGADPNLNPFITTEITSG